jgi:hypothetical protein
MREETLYEVGDGLLTLATNAYFQITITFSEETNMGGAYLGQLFSPTEVEKSFNFSQSLGEAFRGLLGSVLGMIQTFSMLMRNLNFVLLPQAHGRPRQRFKLAFKATLEPDHRKLDICAL